MRLLPLAVVLLVAGTAIAGAEAPQQSKDAKPAAKPSNKPLTLQGCIGPDPSKRGAFMLADAEQATMYRLTGTDVHDYVGRLVQVSGVVPKGLKIVGGLYPTPNVAAQAGTMDPTKAAIAAAEPGNAGVAALSEFRVRSVRVIPGNCPRE